MGFSPRQGSDEAADERGERLRLLDARDVAGAAR